MGSLERQKKGPFTWKRAMIHFSFCFSLGFFTGFTPTNNQTSGRGTGNLQTSKLVASNRNSLDIQKVRRELGYFNRDLREETKIPESGMSDGSGRFVPRQLIIVTPTRLPRHPVQEAYLRNLGHTLKLVSHPLLWIVVEPQTDSVRTVEILRRSRVMYRHIVCKENFTDAEELMVYQRSLALRHIELHRLEGIVHFADVFDAYDLQFFEEIREIEVFGTWPIALMHEIKKRKKKKIQHPLGTLRNESQVLQWFDDTETNVDTYPDTTGDVECCTNPKGFGIELNSSAVVFNSSILWDPLRWGRTSSWDIGSPDQGSMNLIQRLAFEHEMKSHQLGSKRYRKVRLWRLNPAGLIDGTTTANSD